MNRVWVTDDDEGGNASPPHLNEKNCDETRLIVSFTSFVSYDMR
jgi:hypothetical protein